MWRVGGVVLLQTVAMVGDLAWGVVPLKGWQLWVSYAGWAVLVTVLMFWDPVRDWTDPSRRILKRAVEKQKQERTRRIESVLKIPGMQDVEYDHATGRIQGRLRPRKWRGRALRLLTWTATARGGSTGLLRNA